MDKFSFLNTANTDFFSELYQRYIENPDAIEPSWRAFFQGFDFAQEDYSMQLIQSNNSSQKNISPKDNSVLNSQYTQKIEKEFKVINLINGYRSRGHLFTKTNPVRNRRSYTPDLSIENYGLSQNDLDIVFDAAREIGLQPTSLRNIITQLENIFCQSIGVEFAYIEIPEIIEWFKYRLRQNQNLPNFTKDEKLNILNKLNEAVTFENFLHTKYVGQKRFSLEGGESIVPALSILTDQGAQRGVEEFIIGMAHRGRLNILANILGKNPQNIFSEFDGKDYEIDLFDGDVKYHLGQTSEKITSSGKKICIHLAPNPSHLETVGAVIEGIARAKQDQLYSNDSSKVLPIAIHGDAAIAGQGIVYEIVQMSLLEGYRTGGTIHIIINNQVGFTTNYLDARSSTYCTDIAKITLSPVLHVNSDDVEAVTHAMLFALDFRMQFGRDVFLDLLGYRKYGHNEGDEPRFTQPILYKIIAQHDNPRTIYARKLKEQGIITDEYLSEIEENYRQHLEHDLVESRKKELTIITPFMQEQWQGFTNAGQNEMLSSVNTSFPKENLDAIAKELTKLPSDKSFISKIKKIIADREQMYFEKGVVDWGFAEHLAFGTLLSQGYNIRLSGEDVERGTFSHRHAVIKVEDSEEEVILLNNIQKWNKSGKFHIYNSHLSEYGVLGFEYGYALASANTLTIWEAQFGDFANGAQIMIDQYICCGEDKWKNQNGLVMLLPHGYEGQGAEHSSARIERFLQLCATHNMFVANCTTPANFYHLLRRQMTTDFRKPLIVFTPKGLLRHPQVISSVEELANGTFLEVIDQTENQTELIKSVVFCSGRFYYDLLEYQKKHQRTDVALVRIEQLFPLPIQQLKDILNKYTNATDFVWAQEEPKNMGAYTYMLTHFDWIKWRLASMGAFSAPASGSHTRDRKRHQQAIEMVFNS